MQKKFLQPAIYAPIRLISNFIGGTILTLIIAIFIKKENNPLVEISET
jgi:F0F1-type ATP synthase membrane subunit a